MSLGLNHIIRYFAISIILKIAINYTKMYPDVDYTTIIQMPSQSLLFYLVLGLITYFLYKFLIYDKFLWKFQNWLLLYRKQNNCRTYISEQFPEISEENSLKFYYHIRREIIDKFNSNDYQINYSIIHLLYMTTFVLLFCFLSGLFYCKFIWIFLILSPSFFLFGAYLDYKVEQMELNMFKEHYVLYQDKIKEISKAFLN